MSKLTTKQIIAELDKDWSSCDEEENVEITADKKSGKIVCSNASVGKKCALFDTENNLTLRDKRPNRQESEKFNLNDIFKLISATKPNNLTYDLQKVVEQISEKLEVQASEPLRFKINTLLSYYKKHI